MAGKTKASEKEKAPTTQKDAEGKEATKKDKKAAREEKVDLRGYIVLNEQDEDFKYAVAEKPGGENLKYCFACGTCTAGCPVRAIEDKYNPRKIIRMILLGMRKEVLSSDFIWLCSGCYTCSERCPQQVEIPNIMTVIRNMAIREGYVLPAIKIQGRQIRKFGRLYEIDPFDARKREKLGLPPIQAVNPEVIRLLELTGITALLDKVQEEEEKEE